MTELLVEPVDRAEDRGVLDLRLRAVRRIAEQVVRETPGTVAHRSRLGRLTGSGTPRADVVVSGGTARIEVEVSVVWPCAIGEVASHVRERVLAQTARQTGLHVARVDVTIRVVPRDDGDERRRVR